MFESVLIVAASGSFFGLAGIVIGWWLNELSRIDEVQSELREDGWNPNFRSEN